MDLLVQSGGTSTIAEIAREVGWSHKHLITKFKQQVGVAPRLAARLLRLSRVWRHIKTGQSWARIAAESGYADQSHLVREFRQFTGTTPGALDRQLNGAALTQSPARQARSQIRADASGQTRRAPRLPHSHPRAYERD